jgi:hypothetical protein
MKDQRADDWYLVVNGWIKQVEAEMDEAYRADDGPAYTRAARWRYEMLTARGIIEPFRETREMFENMSRELAGGFDAMTRALGPALIALRTFQESHEKSHAGDPSGHS